MSEETNKTKKQTDEQKFEECKGKLDALLAEYNFELTSIPFIGPHGQILSRPVLNPKGTEPVMEGVASPIIVP